MLKIKDNVDLNKLEKFGFEKNKYGGYTYEIEKCKNWYRPKDKHKKLLKDIQREKINIDKERRRIFILYDLKTQTESYGMGGSIYDLEVLYDLIQAGLVEKVNEER